MKGSRTNPGLTELPPPPEHLREPGRRLWTHTLESRVLETEPWRLDILRLAGEAADRAEAARLQLEQDAPAGTTTDRFKQVKVHPAASVERDARGAVARLLDAAVKYAVRRALAETS